MSYIIQNGTIKTGECRFFTAILVSIKDLVRGIPTLKYFKWNILSMGDSPFKFVTQFTFKFVNRFTIGTAIYLQDHLSEGLEKQGFRKLLKCQQLESNVFEYANFRNNEGFQVIQWLNHLIQ